MYMNVSAYEGNLPYAFVSYAHADGEAVAGLFQDMAKAGLRMWYDDGIEGNVEWDERLSQKIRNSACVLALVSENYLKSDNCLDELKYAREQKRNVLMIYLEPVTLTGGLAMRFNRYQALMRYECAGRADFLQRLSRSRGVADCLGQPPETPEAPEYPEEPEPAPESELERAQRMSGLRDFARQYGPAAMAYFRRALKFPGILCLVQTAVFAAMTLTGQWTYLGRSVPERLVCGGLMLLVFPVLVCLISAYSLSIAWNERFLRKRLTACVLWLLLSGAGYMVMFNWMTGYGRIAYQSEAVFRFSEEQFWLATSLGALEHAAFALWSVTYALKRPRS